MALRTSDTIDNRCQAQRLTAPLPGATLSPRWASWQSGAKRAIDIAVAATLLLVLLPLFALIALLIKLDSRGPVLFRQVRSGKDGKPFVFLKFRSMVADAEQRRAELEALNNADGPIFKMRRDPRATRVGRVLRRTSLDELPQLWNVLRGDMSLVGPRPPLPDEVARYAPWQHGRLAVRPGLTGLWQVSGRSLLGFEQMVMLDLEYIARWSLALDLRIVLRTIGAVLSMRGAY